MNNSLSLHVLPIIPLWAIAAVMLVLLALLAQGSVLLLRKRVPPRWVAILAGLRLAAILLFAVCLLQPIVSYTRRVSQLPELLVLVDASQSMGLPGGKSGSTSSATTGAANGAATRETRLDDLRASLGQGDLATALGSRFRTHWFAFDRQAVPLPSGDLAEVRPVGETTRFAESLQGAWNELRLTGRTEGAAPPRVLLASDGNDLGSEDVVETARRLGIVIDTLVPGDTRQADERLPLEIAGVQTAQRVLLGSETRFQVMLRGAAGAARKFRLTLTDEGKEVHAQDIMIPQDASEVQVPVAFRPQEAGLKRYLFHVAPAGGAPADAIPAAAGKESEAGGYAVNLEVLGDKHELLILADKWRWDFKFLRRILEDDPHFSFTAMLSRGDKAFAQFGEPERKVSLGGFPQTRQELEWFDTILLEDVDPTRWPKGLSAGLSRAVVDDGKSLVVVAGPNLGKFAERPELAALLPVEISASAGVPVEGPVDVQVSGDGTRSAFFFQPPGSISREASSPFPPLDQIYPTLRKRPAATVLLEAVRHVNTSGNMIVIAEQTVGRGRVLFIGSDNLWKWQMQGPANDAGVTIYRLFWQQALRALAPVRANSGGVHVWLQPDKSRYESGSRVLLRSEVQSDRPLPAFKLESSVVLPNGRQLPLVFVADAENPQQYVAEFETSLVGRYRLSAAVKSEGKPLSDVSTAIEVQAAPTEANNRPVDTAQMTRIATATGGKAISIDDSATWPESGSAATLVSQRVTIDLWSNFTLLIALSLLLGTDWLLRLVRGYV